MRHLFTAIVTAVEAVAIAVVSFSVIAAGALLMWLLPFSMQAELVTMLSATAEIWGLAHGVPITVAPDEEILAALGLDQGFRFVLSLIPLGLSLITIWLAVRLSLRVSRIEGASWLVLTAATIGFAFASVVILWVATGFEYMPDPWYVMVSASCFAIPAWLTLLVKSFPSFIDSGRISGTARSVLHFVPRTIKLAVALATSVIIIGSVAFAMTLVANYPEVMRLSQILHLDLLGTIIVLLLQLSFLPVVIIWSIAWMSGAGFSLGLGSTVTPFETLLGPLPAIPILGAIPSSFGEWGLLAAIVIVLGAVFIGILFGALPEFRQPAIWSTLLVSFVSAILAALILTGLAVLSTGSIGPGRMEFVGIAAWPFAGIIFAQIFFGVALGVLLRRIPKIAKRSKLSILQEKTEHRERSGQLERSVMLEHSDQLESSDQLELLEHEQLTADLSLTVADDQETEAITTDLSRIADPKEEQEKPWFRRIPKSKKAVEPVEVSEPLEEIETILPVKTTPNLTEEELIEEYSWEALTKSEEGGKEQK